MRVETSKFRQISGLIYVGVPWFGGAEREKESTPPPRFWYGEPSVSVHGSYGTRCGDRGEHRYSHFAARKSTPPPCFWTSRVAAPPLLPFLAWLPTLILSHNSPSSLIKPWSTPLLRLLCVAAAHCRAVPQGCCREPQQVAHQCGLWGGRGEDGLGWLLRWTRRGRWQWKKESHWNITVHVICHRGKTACETALGGYLLWFGKFKG